MSIQQSFKNMVEAAGGQIETANAFGKSLSWLQNRLYGKKDQTFSIEDAMSLQVISGTTHFAASIAEESGGVFVQLPAATEEPDNEELLEKFLKLTAQYGALAKRHQEATADGEVDDVEMADLKKIGQSIHQTVEEINALTERIYKRVPAPAAQPRAVKVV